MTIEAEPKVFYQRCGFGDALGSRSCTVPGIVSILYLPTPGEMQAIAKAMAAAPGTTRSGDTQAERRQLAKNVEDIRARHWRLDTTISPDAVMSFYRKQPRRRDWKIASDSPPFLIDARKGA